MAAEVKPRQCIPPGEEKPCSAHKTPRKAKAAGGRSRNIELFEKPVKDEDEHRARGCVLQGKVKALKEKHMKERRETRILEEEGGEKGNHEDALVSPQLRTYLTDELLECTKHGAHQQNWGCDELWGMYSSDGSSDIPSKGCKVIKPSKHHQTKENNSSFSHQEQLKASVNDLSVTENTTKWDSASLTLAERVERNRQELRSKFGKTADHGGERPRSRDLGQGQPIKSWVITSEEDGDLRVEVPEAEDSGELSARHEQAKQLLQRARMKAKGASPLRASHCVLTHPHSQPTLCRGSNLSGAVTDGGSLSDSSSSEYSSWHKGSRGSSPSHVRFQDESERDVEERYRERQQVPQKVATPPTQRQANGPVSWTEQVSPSGHGQCGACGSYVKPTGNNPAATHGTNLRNVHLGSKMTQDGSVSCPLGVKPSPHWILPSQPWRMYTELIRETHIGSDSTPDSSGDDDGNRSHNKKSCDCVMQRHCRNNSANAEHGGRVNPSNLCLESDIRAGRSQSDQNNGNKIGTLSNTLENRVKKKSNHLESANKTSETNQMSSAARAYGVDSGLRKSPQNTQMKLTRKHKNPAQEFVTDQNEYIQDTGIGAVVLDMDIKGNHRIDFKDCRSQVSPGVQCTSHVGSPPFTSGHVPVPPSGKAPIMMPSRNRLALRSGGISQQPHNSQEGDTVQNCHDKKEPQFKPVPNNKKNTQETYGTSDGHQLSTQGITSKEYQSRDKTKTHTEDRKSKEVKENGDYVKYQESRKLDKPYTSSRQKDYDRHPSFKDQRDKDHLQINLSKEHKKGEVHFKREEKSADKFEINGQLTCNNNANTGSAQCSRENSFHCQTGDLGMSSKDRYLEPADEGSLQPAVKKGDLRSGMRKIFSSIGLAPRPKLERFQSSSLEQISSPDHFGSSALAHGDTESSDGSVKPGKIKKSPSLQSLKLMSPFHLPRKSSSVQNLLGKSDRSAVYITGDVSTAPRRTLSVEDIGSPGKARVLGKVAQVYPDGTRLLELQRPESGTFGFRISAGNGRPDLGIYVQEMSDADTAKLYSGLLRVGDEVLEVNGTKVSILGKTHLTELMNREPVLSLRVLHQRRTKC